MPQTRGLGWAKLSCSGCVVGGVEGIWSCIDDTDFGWVTAESGLATVCWKGVKWRASTWAGWPLPGRRKQRETSERFRLSGLRASGKGRGKKKALGHIINLSLNMEWRREYALVIFLSKFYTPTLPRANSCFQILKSPPQNVRLRSLPGRCVLDNLARAWTSPRTSPLSAASRIWKEHCVPLHAPQPIDSFCHQANALFT